MKIKVNDQDTTQEGADEDADVVERLAAELALISPSPDTAARIAPTEFEKDDDANFHVPGGLRDPIFRRSRGGWTRERSLASRIAHRASLSHKR